MMVKVVTRREKTLRGNWHARDPALGERAFFVFSAPMRGSDGDDHHLLDPIHTVMSAFRAASMLRLPRAFGVARAPVRSLTTARPVPTAIPRAVFATPIQSRTYASSSGLSSQEIQNRIFEVLKSFEKVDPAKVRPARFMKVFY